jgi:tRNA nucleotidyltransferase/poly(A) polymerase
MRIPRVAKNLAAVFASRGFQCHLVGGAVRDMMMGRSLSDLDIATDALPEQVSSLFRRVVPTGIRHGTVTVLFQGARFEVTTFRTESSYSDGRRPDSVSFAPSILDDLSRRDFTINAMAYDLLAGRMEDPHGGARDLANRLIRAIGVPEERFREDGLRPLRACRFAAQLGFSVDSETLLAIPRTLDVVAGVSAERVRDEVLKILASPVPSVGLELMRGTGILGVVLPELCEGVGVAQGDLHCYDVFTHSLRACDAAPAGPVGPAAALGAPAGPVGPAAVELRLAALLHDVGKPRALRMDEGGRPTFHGHEKLSRDLASSILQRLRLPTAVVRRVAHLVEHHMFNYQEEWSDAAVRRFIARVGEDAIDDLLALRRADQIGMCAENADVFPKGLSLLAERLRAVREGDRAFSVRELAVDGSDVMTRLGIGPGPAIGTILAALLQAVLEDPALNEKEKLLVIAGRFYRERMGGV